MGDTNNKLIPFQLHSFIVGVILTPNPDSCTDVINRVSPNSHNQKLAMPPANQQPSTNPASNLDFFTIPQSFLLQIGTASILLLLITGKTTVRALEAIGEASEELLRGDRLPNLDFPEDHKTNQT